MDIYMNEEIKVFECTSGHLGAIYWQLPWLHVFKPKITENVLPVNELSYSSQKEQSHQGGTEPGTFLLWGDSVTHLAEKKTLQQL